MLKPLLIVSILLVANLAQPVTRAEPPPVTSIPASPPEQEAEAPWNGWISIELLRDATFLIENQTNREIAVRGTLPKSPRTVVAPGDTARRVARYGAGISVCYTGTRVELSGDPSMSCTIERMNIASLPRVVVTVQDGAFEISHTPPSEIENRPTIGDFAILGPASPGGAVTRVTDRFWIQNTTGEWIAGHLTVFNEDNNSRPVAVFRVDLDPDHDVTLALPDLPPAPSFEFQWISFDASLPERRIGQRDKIDWTYETMGQFKIRGLNFEQSRQFLSISHAVSGCAFTTTGLRDRVPERWLPIVRDEDWLGEIETIHNQDAALTVINRTNRTISVANAEGLLWSIEPPQAATVIPPEESAVLPVAAAVAHLCVWPPNSFEPIEIFSMQESPRSINEISGGSVSRLTSRSR